MEPRIRHSNMPTYLEEDIMPMEDEFKGPLRRWTYAALIIVGVLFWTAVFS